jgi:hypothetical protein
VTTVWADERVYYPLHAEPYTPASYLPRKQADPEFRTKLQIAGDLIAEAPVVAPLSPFRAPRSQPCLSRT